ESFVGGPLALVETGDEIEVDAAARRIHLHVSDAELAARRQAWQPPAPRYPRGYGAMFSAHIGQADEGCDFDYLLAGEKIPEPEFHGGWGPARLWQRVPPDLHCVRVPRIGTSQSALDMAHQIFSRGDVESGPARASLG